MQRVNKENKVGKHEFIREMIGTRLREVKAGCRRGQKRVQYNDN